MAPSADIGKSAPLLPLAGEGGAVGRRKTPVFRRAMAPDEGPLQPLATAAGPHPNPLPQAGEGARTLPIG